MTPEEESADRCSFAPACRGRPADSARRDVVHARAGVRALFPMLPARWTAQPRGTPGHSRKVGHVAGPGHQMRPVSTLSV